MAESKIIKQKNEWKTVWTNPNPTQPFESGQTISVDLSPYTEILVALKATLQGTAIYYNIIPVPSSPTIISCVSETIWIRYAFECTTDSINFGTGAIANTYGTRTDTTSGAIPVAVLAR